MQEGVVAVMPARLPHGEAQVEAHRIGAGIPVREMRGDAEAAAHFEEIPRRAIRQRRSRLLEESPLVVVILISQITPS